MNTTVLLVYCTKVFFAFCYRASYSEHSIINLYRRIEMHCKKNMFGHCFFCATKSKPFNLSSVWHYWMKKCENLFLSCHSVLNEILYIKSRTSIHYRNYQKTQWFVPITFRIHDIVIYSKYGATAEWHQRLKALIHSLFHRRYKTS